MTGSWRPTADGDREALRAFLESSFGAAKAAFLDRHGEWWNGGPENRLMREVDGQVAGYCAFIPARCLVGGRERRALWWTDLVVAPDLRGRGLQSEVDLLIRERGELVLGFPNELAARIHRRHGWGVREDLRAMLAPLRPRQLHAVHGTARTAVALVLEPLAAVLRRRRAAYRPRWAAPLDDPDPEHLASLAGHTPPRLETTVRDAAHFTRRYLEAPYRGELRFYDAGTLGLVARRLRRGGRLEERVLDVFGDLDDHRRTGDLLRFVLGRAAAAGVVQVTALAGYPRLARAFARSGFTLRRTARLCFWSDDPGDRAALGGGRLHWSLGDSDNDEPARG